MGFLLFAVLTFASVIVMQEILWHLPFGLLPYGLMAWYGYLAVTLSMYGVFATYISIIHTAVLLILAGAYWMVAVLVRYVRKPAAVSG